MAGTTTDHESLVNLPNWLPLTFRIDGGDWFDVDAVELLSYRQVLDIRGAVLTRELRFRDDAGRTTSVTQHRFVAMHRRTSPRWRRPSSPRTGRARSRSARRSTPTSATAGGALSRAGQHPPGVPDKACAVAEFGAAGGRDDAVADSGRAGRADHGVARRLARARDVSTRRRGVRGRPRDLHRPGGRSVAVGGEGRHVGHRP